jgi:hypothetical protein
MSFKVERSAVAFLSNLPQSLRPAAEKIGQPQLLLNRWVLLGGSFLAAWLLIDVWNGAWIDGYHAGRCEAKCGFAADHIEIEPERQQIVCTCRDRSVWRLSE